MRSCLEQLHYSPFSDCGHQRPISKAVVPIRHKCMIESMLKSSIAAITTSRGTFRGLRQAAVAPPTAKSTASPRCSACWHPTFNKDLPLTCQRQTLVAQQVVAVNLRVYRDGIDLLHAFSPMAPVVLPRQQMPQYFVDGENKWTPHKEKRVN